MVPVSSEFLQRGAGLERRIISRPMIKRVAIGQVLRIHNNQSKPLITK